MSVILYFTEHDLPKFDETVALLSMHHRNTLEQNEEDQITFMKVQKLNIEQKHAESLSRRNTFDSKCTNAISARRI